jgi:hypothetical protein
MHSPVITVLAETKWKWTDWLFEIALLLSAADGWLGRFSADPFALAL